MKGRIERFSLSQRDCAFFSPAGAGPVPLIFALCGDEFSEELPQVLAALPAGCPPFRLCWFGPSDWNRDYSPWPEEALSKAGGAFSGGAASTFAFVREELLPFAARRYPVTEALLLGYSLGGLAALWALCSGENFSGCACCSGSLWYEGWLSYLREHSPRAGSRVYLSLGRKEERARSPRMARVGEATRETYSILSGVPGVKAALAWQDGGHFYQIPQRLARGIYWLLAEKTLDGEK